MRSSELRELLQAVSTRYGIDTMTHFYLVYMKHRPASILIFRSPDEIENVRRILRLLNATIAKYPVGTFSYLIFLNTDENRTIYDQINQSYNPANKSTNRVELDTLTGTFLGYLTPKPLRNLQFPGRIATHITVNTNIKSSICLKKKYAKKWNLFEKV